ncbi:hypothetical protein R1sor_025593 [Riccia sorocarpa]|uniref:Endonuclease/exonuclease/phosphatase domain-containing protein n=1 Tax=Riccia sorocarpa TaxID=122646 RepID=A0ABD3G936_9MARC
MSHTDSEQQDSLNGNLPEALINQLSKLEVAVQATDSTPANFTPIPPSFRKADRDKALADEIATIPTSTAAHFTWTPECENQGFKPVEVPTWIRLSGIPSWLKDSVTGIFQSVGPVLRLPLATKGLANQEVSALILWNPNSEPLKSVLVDLELPGGKRARLAFPARFEVQKTEDEGHTVNSKQTNLLERLKSWQDVLTLFRNKPAQGQAASAAEEDGQADQGSWGLNFFVLLAFLVVLMADLVNTSISSIFARAFLKLSIWNVRGLANFHRRAAIRAFLKQFTPHVLLLQETHISVQRLSFLVATISPDYSVVGADSNGASGGIAFLVHRTVMAGEGANVSSKFIWRRFALNGVDFNLAGVHGPNDPHERTVFWEEVAHILPDLPFHLLGDFNNVESSSDSSSRMSRMTAKETSSFFRLCNTFNLFDARLLAREKIGPKWTRFERRNGEFSWSRLDRIYIPLDFFQAEYVSLVHHVAFQLSDHIPVSCVFSPESALIETPRSFFFKADALVLRKPEIKLALRGVWERHLASSSSQGLELFAQAWTELRRETKRLQYAELQKLSDLDQLKLELERLSALSDPSEEDLLLILSTAREVSRLQAWQDHRWCIWSRERYLQLGDVSSPYFLKRFRARRARSKILALVSSDATRITSTDGICQEVFRHFSQIFQQPPQLADPEKQSTFLGEFRAKISPAQSAFMDSEPTLGEFTDVLLASAKGKSPGMDDFNVDALIEIWDFLGPTYVDAMVYC